MRFAIGIPCITGRSLSLFDPVRSSFKLRSPLALVTLRLCTARLYSTIPMVKPTSDPSSFSNFAQLRTKHLSLNLDVDFTHQVLKGSVVISAEAQVDGASELILDTRDLKISHIDAGGHELKLTYAQPHAALGTAAHIALASPLKKGAKIDVKISYETSPTAMAVQWLAPSQTAGKQHPYLFTQCQAIHARSMVPCQDSPAVKATYDATITVPSPLTALMSALRDGVEERGDKRAFKFKQPVVMPSYLIALAVGHLESRQIGPRSLVWSEKETVEAGAFEFAETESYLKAGESLLGPYVWTQYDVLLLPPSFPYGGMENPCLTFVTPTLLAGDRSLANVVAHEIAHSWTGNLVSPATWEHFWLNEGFTVFVERKMLERTSPQGVKAFHFAALGGFKDLRDSVEVFKATPELTALVPKLDGIDPDDAFSSVPYEKGFYFLYYLQTLVGDIPAFEKFLHDYIQKHAYESITSDDFKADFLAVFGKNPKVNEIDWNTWFHAPGLPTVTNKYDTTLADEVIALATKYSKGNVQPAKADIANFSSKQLVLFLETVVEQEPLPSKDVLLAMDAAYNLTASRNSEIRFRWYQLRLKAADETVFPLVVQFLREQGRMKYVRPLHRAMAKVPGGKDILVANFKEHHQAYHPVCAKLVAKDLDIKL